ncbi:MAG: matrixin family metalloprotease [Bryobacteraceae bacterium]
MERLAVWIRLAMALGMVWNWSLWAEVQMKSREGNAQLSNRTSRAKSRQASRSHLILDFQEAPTPETARLLEARGMRVAAYLPPTGVIVGLNGEPNLHGLNLAGFDALQPADKLSHELARAAGDGGRGAGRLSRRAYYVVEFHGDVPWGERRELVVESGMEIRDHRDLVGEHMLVRGTLEQVRTLADWDEVAYIFPASGELATGLPLVGCVGGATEAGQVGQLTQRVGEGWDGPGLHPANLTFSTQGTTGRLPEEQVQSEIQRAMADWSRVVQVNFLRTNTASGPKNINILFGSRDHGDPYPFDGAGRVLAHTFYPAPPNPEPIAGDLHFDNDELWNIGSDVDVYSVALHELGHALGLGHSDVPNAVMYPYYRRATGLTPEDVGAIRMLYAAASDDDDEGGTPAALTFTVSAPASPASTTGATINVSGTLTGPVGSPSLRWNTDRGSSGAGVVTADSRGGYLWQAVSVPLAMGDNRIVLTATDAAGRSIGGTVQVQRVAVPVSPPPTPPVPPTPAPTPIPVLSLEVAAPGANAVVTRNPITANGTVGGGTGRPTVRWSSDRGFAGTAVLTATADGKYRWDVNPLALQLGANTITVTATDTVSRTNSQTIRVNYTAASGDDPNADGVAPRVTIVSPNTTFLMTPIYSLSVRGTAFDYAGVSEVRWECTCGSRGVAQGTSQWTIPNIGLPVGTHTIKVTAKDPSGNEGTDSFMVFRYND